ncbi:RHS repeat-associated core domain-containing protein, partial [Ruminiclostridium hungatei]|uniref:RHS repeat-associated core domain-containing protein n=1 Tax=Ruminiclostridium hungatei TaxID=48256 RepID=UPI0010554FAA
STPGAAKDNTDITINEYDGFNQLIKTSTGDITAEYTYDGNGLRTSKNINGIVTSHIWDGSQIILETNGAGEVTSKYVRGINLICSEDGTGANRRFFLYNGHGDVVQLTDTSGNSIKVYDYDAFGNEKNPDANDTNVFRYCSEYFDKETGTIYLRARYYDPMIGRFITEDSYWGKDNDPLSLNLYTYCANDPVGLFDPSGHRAVATGPFGLIKKVMETALNIGKDMYIYDYKFTTAAGAYFLDMRVDKNGIYHANFDCWQSAFGYNNFY